jgi:DNA invertase Pin-like site-specific DNA recombinase
MGVSTEEQAHGCAGLAAQRATILAEAERRGWRPVEVIEDAGYSGKSLERPGIKAALDALQSTRADTFVVSRLDRLPTSMLDFTGLLDCARRERWALVALDLRIDMATPAGEAMANSMATFAQFERRLIGQRTREAPAQKREARVTLGRRANLPDEVIARIVTERAAGKSLSAIAAGLDSDAVPTAQGGRRWYSSTVKTVLNRAVHGSSRGDRGVRAG